MLLLRDQLVQLVPPQAPGASAAGPGLQPAAPSGRFGGPSGGLPGLPALMPTAFGGGGLGGGGGQSGGGDATPTSADLLFTPRAGPPFGDPLEQPRGGGAAGGGGSGACGSSPAAPGILFKAAATIGEEIVLCALRSAACLPRQPCPACRAACPATLGARAALPGSSLTHLVLPPTRRNPPAGHSMIAGVVDAQGAAAGCLVAEGVSEELDALRELFWGLPDLLTQLVRWLGDAGWLRAEAGMRQAPARCRPLLL